MQDFQFVKTLQTFDYLDDNLPYVLLLHELLVILALTDALEHISIVCELHNNATQKQFD